MHPKNPYRTPIDFVALSEQYPPLKPYVKHVDKKGPPANIDYKDVDAQRRLTEALLSCDFGITLVLPKDRLCPPVPNRLNYVLWLHDVIEESYRTLPRCDQVLGLDVGIGASAIYPLLGCRLYSYWHFVGTEIDPLSFEYATQNIEANKLHDRINVVKTSPTDPLYAQISRIEGKQFAFTMCNPPFYSSTEEVASSAESKLFGPNAVCTGAEVEMITTGGEEVFVSRMVDESLEAAMRYRCLWFSSMLGKFSSVGAVVSKLQAHQIDNYAVTELVQGQTRRWVVAWSFTDVRLPDFLSRSLSPVHRTVLPQHNTLSLSVGPYSVVDAKALLDTFTQVIRVLDDVALQDVPPAQSELARMHPDLSGEAFAIRISAARNSWSRAARRIRDKQSASEGSTESSSDVIIRESRSFHASSTAAAATATATTTATTTTYPISAGPPAMIVDIQAYRDPAPTFRKQTRESTSLRLQRWTLECTWRRGYDRSLFESFWSYVARKVTMALKAQDDADADASSAK